MAAETVAYLFFLGLSAGISLMTLTAYRRVSPSWLKALLVLTSLLMVGRSATLAVLASAANPVYFGWWLRLFWMSGMLCLTLPGVMALDWLIRHPAMSPKKLLERFSPFLAVYAAVFFFAPIKASPDPTAGWVLQLNHPWSGILTATQLVFMAGFIVMSVLLARKIASTPIQTALVCLMLGYGLYLLDAFLPAANQWHFRRFLFSEMAIQLGFWKAFETGTALQN